MIEIEVMIFGYIYGLRSGCSFYCLEHLLFIVVNIRSKRSNHDFGDNHRSIENTSGKKIREGVYNGRLECDGNTRSCCCREVLLFELL